MQEVCSHILLYSHREQLLNQWLKSCLAIKAGFCFFVSFAKSRCKEDEEVVKSCTAHSNTVCQKRDSASANITAGSHRHTDTQHIISCSPSMAESHKPTSYVKLPKVEVRLRGGANNPT